MQFTQLANVLVNGPVNLPTGISDLGPFPIPDAYTKASMKIDRWIGPTTMLKLSVVTSVDGGATWKPWLQTVPDPGDPTTGGKALPIIWGPGLIPPGTGRQLKASLDVQNGPLATTAILTAE